MYKNIIIVLLAGAVITGWLVFKNYNISLVTGVNKKNTTVVEQTFQNNTISATTTSVSANLNQYKNTTIGASFLYPSNLVLKKDNSSSDSNVVNIGTIRLVDTATDKTYLTIYETPVEVGSFGAQTKLHKEKVVNGKILRMYYETSGSLAPTSIGIGWGSKNTAYIFFSPSQLPTSLKDLPDTVFDSIELD